MKNLLNFFFSFDKLFKEKLVVPFFWLALVVFGLAFFAEGLDSIRLGILAKILWFINYFASFLLGLVIIRILAELMVAIFRINDNLSPDGGKSELADIDPVAEARKAAEAAAAKTREATRTVTEKATEATKSMSDSVQDKAKAASASVKEKADDLGNKASKPSLEKVVKEKAAAKAAPAAAPKKRGRPAGSKNKTKSKPAAKPATTTAPKRRGRPVGSKNKTSAAKKTSTAAKRGPKPGTKVPRDTDGNLLKKDGTPRKKPGPKKS